MSNFSEKDLTQDPLLSLIPPILKPFLTGFMENAKALGNQRSWR